MWKNWESLVGYIEQMSILGMEDENSIDVLTIVAGQDKSGNKEGFERLDIHKSEIISIVGPTGSGKSKASCWHRMDCPEGYADKASDSYKWWISR